MNEINTLYQNHVLHELQLANTQTTALLNKNKIDQKILAFLAELGKVGEESQCFSFWDSSKSDAKEILDYYIEGLQLLLSIGFELQIDRLKNHSEIPSKDSLVHQFIKVYEGTLKIRNTYSFEDYQNNIDDYFILGFSLGFSFDDIMKKYQEHI